MFGLCYYNEKQNTKNHTHMIKYDFYWTTKNWIPVFSNIIRLDVRSVSMTKYVKLETIKYNPAPFYLYCSNAYDHDMGLGKTILRSRL